MGEQFKPGDEVVCVRPHDDGKLKKGSVYIIHSLDDDLVTVQGLPRDWYLSDRFQTPCLGNPPAPEPDPVQERALRFNAGKPELFYTDMFPAAVEGVACTLMYGTKREKNPYPKFNWCKGAKFSELYDCARRHMIKWLNGEDMDPDAVANGFDICHLDFAIGNLMRLRQQIADGRTDLDDRGWRQGQEPKE